MNLHRSDFSPLLIYLVFCFLVSPDMKFVIIHSQCNKKQSDDDAILNRDREEDNGQVVSAYQAMLLLIGSVKTSLSRPDMSPNLFV